MIFPLSFLLVVIDGPTSRFADHCTETVTCETRESMAYSVVMWSFDLAKVPILTASFVFVD